MNKRFLTALMALAALSSGAWALNSDSDQPIQVHADRFNGDEVKQTAVYTGNVTVDQGTMNITGNQLDLSITPKGYRRAVMHGKPARFKQQRDPKTPGIDEWVHARALTIIYDEETDTITLVTDAYLSRTENGVEKDMTSGTRIVYSRRTGRSQVESGKGERVTTVIAPRSSGASKDTKAAPERKGARLSGSTAITPEKGAKRD